MAPQRQAERSSALPCPKLAQDGALSPMRNAGERGGKLLEVRLENGANDFKNERAIAMQSELRRTALSAVTTEAYEIAICFLFG